MLLGKMSSMLYGCVVFDSVPKEIDRLDQFHPSSSASVIWYGARVQPSAAYAQAPTAC